MIVQDNSPRVRSMTTGATISRLDRLLAARLEARRADATRRASEVLSKLRVMGIEAAVFGSLATGRFKLHSDVDYLVRRLPPELKYRIEGLVDRIMGDIPFSLVYEDEIRPEILRRALAQLRYEPDLRARA